MVVDNLLPFLPATLSFSSTIDASYIATGSCISKGTVIPTRQQFHARMTGSPAALQVFADSLLVAEIISVSEDGKLSECPEDSFNVIIDVSVSKTGVTNVVVSSKNSSSVIGEVSIPVA